LKYTEFKNGLENGEVFSVYLFEGEDAYFRERGLTLLKNKFVSEPSLNFVSFGGDVSLSELLTSLEGYPFMSEKRLTAVREFYPKADFIKKGLGDFINNPSSTSILVILNEKACEPLKKCNSICVVDCSKQDVYLLIKWIRAECGKANVSIDGETAKLLAEYCSCDMTRIETETAKLIAYVGNGGNISNDDVYDMVSQDTEYKIYEMTDFIANKMFDKALMVIKDMMSKGEPAQRIIVSIYFYFRKLLHVAISDSDNKELAEMLGMQEFAVRKVKQQADKFKKKALKNAVDSLIDLDCKIKSGLIDADDGMFKTIFKIMLEN
jgi:DNA polymerase-3 subunit delta